MAASILGTTASSRYSGNLNNNLLKMSTNLIPFPRMHFFSVTHTKISKPNLNQLISSSMNRNNTLCQVDHS
jgi:tubulin beta